MSRRWSLAPGPARSGQAATSLSPMRLVAHRCHPGGLIEANPHHMVEALTHRIDMGDENDLREAVGQASEQLHYRVAAILIQ